MGLPFFLYGVDMAILTPTTELEAINMMLASIGESPIAALNDGLVDAEIASNYLNQISKATQLQGWAFNTLKDYTLTPDNDGYINLPLNTLKVIVPGERRYTQRGSKMYDNESHTDVFSSSLTVDLVIALEFDQLSEALRQYLYMAAGRRFQDNMAAEPSIHSISKEDELRAKANFWNEAADEERFNVAEQSSTVVNIKGNYRA